MKHKFDDNEEPFEDDYRIDKSDLNEKAKLAFIKICADKAWFKFPYRFLDFMGLKEAVVLAYLFNLSNFWVTQKGSEKKRGWFYFTVEKMRKKLRIDQSTQYRILKTLVDLEYIGVKVKGIPRKRYIRLNYDAIMEVMASDHNL